MPTLGEFTSIRGNPGIGAGTAPGYNLAALPADYNLISIMNTAAQAQADANKYALEQYHKNIKETLDNFNTIDVKGLMEKDYPLIRSQWAQLATDMAENYDVIGNPWKNQEKYAELRNRETQLRGQIAESKQHLALRNDYQTYLGQHKDFETPENIAKMGAFSSQDLGQRDPSLLLNPLPRFDAAQKDIAKAANLAAEQKLTTEVAKGNFLTKQAQIKYLDQAFDDAVLSQMGAQDAYGRPQRQAVADAYKQMAPEIQQQYLGPGGVPDLDRFGLEVLYRPLKNQDSALTTLQANPFAEIAARGAESRRNLRLADALKDADNDMEGVVTQLLARQRNAFSQPDMPGATAETIQTHQVSQKGAKYEDWDIKKLFGPNQTTTTETKNVQGVPLPLDTWSINAYSIPGPKIKQYDPDTDKEVSQDSFLRPSAAWVTTEKDPNSRKIIVRYKVPKADGDGEEIRDVPYSYTQHFQQLDGVYGTKDALKVGDAKTKVSEKRYGTITPDFEKLVNDPLLATPQANVQLQETVDIPVGEQLPVPADRAAQLGAAGVIPQNTTTGEFDFNATRRKKNK